MKGGKLALALALLGALTVPARAATVSPEDAASHVGETAPKFLLY